MSLVFTNTVCPLFHAIYSNISFQHFARVQEIVSEINCAYKICVNQLVEATLAVPSISTV